MRRADPYPYRRRLPCQIHCRRGAGLSPAAGGLLLRLPQAGAVRRVALSGHGGAGLYRPELVVLDLPKRPSLPVCVAVLPPGRYAGGMRPARQALGLLAGGTGLRAAALAQLPDDLRPGYAAVDSLRRDDDAGCHPSELVASTEKARRGAGHHGLCGGAGCPDVGPVGYAAVRPGPGYPILLPLHLFRYRRPTGAGAGAELGQRRPPPGTHPIFRVSELHL